MLCITIIVILMPLHELTNITYVYIQYLLAQFLKHNHGGWWQFFTCHSTSLKSFYQMSMLKCEGTD